MPDRAARSERTGVVVLLSGGLDSSYNLYRARQEHDVLLALTFDYGQVAAEREASTARALCERLGVPHRVIALPWFREFTKSSLVSGEHIPSGTDVRIDDLERSLETAKAVWVPNRNGILLNIAAGFAEGLGAAFVIPGFNYEEAQTFPDNSTAYLRALDEAWSFSTESRVRTCCYSAALNKTQIVHECLSLAVPLSELWPCYRNGENWCGKCESCQRYRRACETNGLDFALLQGIDE